MGQEGEEIDQSGLTYGVSLPPVVFEIHTTVPHLPDVAFVYTSTGNIAHRLSTFEDDIPLH